MDIETAMLARHVCMVKLQLRSDMLDRRLFIASASALVASPAGA
jgi:hypothetical protein